MAYRKRDFHEPKNSEVLDEKVCTEHLDTDDDKTSSFSYNITFVTGGSDGLVCH